MPDDRPTTPMAKQAAFLDFTNNLIADVAPKEGGELRIRRVYHGVLRVLRSLDGAWVLA